MTEVVAALIWDQGKFMICQRPAHKARGLLWEFVGGKVEPSETKEQALIRECQEELAITLDVGEIFMDVIHKYPDLTVHLTLHTAMTPAPIWVAATLRTAGGWISWPRKPAGPSVTWVKTAGRFPRRSLTFLLIPIC